MDTKALVNEAKARFSHNAAKSYLRDKYDSKLFVADQGGLWKADIQTISFLNSLAHAGQSTILIDTFGNPVKINIVDLLTKLLEIYNSVMDEYYREFKEIENNR